MHAAVLGHDQRAVGIKRQALNVGVAGRNRLKTATAVGRADHLHATEVRGVFVVGVGDGTQIIVPTDLSAEIARFVRCPAVAGVARHVDRWTPATSEHVDTAGIDRRNRNRNLFGIARKAAAYLREARATVRRLVHTRLGRRRIEYG